MTLRAYVHTLRFEDNLYGHKFFANAAKSIVKVTSLYTCHSCHSQCYLHLYDHPVTQQTKSEEEELGMLTVGYSDMH